MQFTLQTFFLLFVVLWTSMGVFGVVGIGVFVDVLLFAVIIHFLRSPIVVAAAIGLLVLGFCFGIILDLSESEPRQLGVDWARLAALPIWLPSTGFLLRRAWRSRTTATVDPQAPTDSRRGGDPL